MKKFYLILGVFSIILSSLSCQRKDKEDEGEEARLLFNESSSLLIEVIDKLKEAPDSLNVDSLRNIFEKKIVEINFSFPPETDLKLSEEENDSLFKLMQKMKIVSSQKLDDLSIHVYDTIPSEI